VTVTVQVEKQVECHSKHTSSAATATLDWTSASEDCAGSSPIIQRPKVGFAIDQQSFGAAP